MAHQREIQYNPQRVAGNENSPRNEEPTLANMVEQKSELKMLQIRIESPAQGNNINLADLVTLLRNIQNLPPNPQAPQPPQQPTTQLQVVDQFHRFKPSTFNGRDGPAALEEWMENIEGILKLIICTDTQRVACASFQLKEDARIWWNSYWSMRPENERTELSWADFKRIVMEKYYPPSYQMRMESEFFNLKQGDMTVEEYERKFSKMCRFTPHLVDTNEKKAQRFRYGLRSEIRNVISGHGLKNLSDTFARAEDIAASIAMDAPNPKTEEFSRKRKWDGASQNRNWNPNKQGRVVEDTVHGGYKDKPTCANCGKKHFGECLLGQNRCFRCHELGHTLPNCPRNQNGGIRRRPNTGVGGNARMFAMTREEAD